MQTQETTIKHMTTQETPRKHKQNPRTHQTIHTKKHTQQKTT